MSLADNWYVSKCDEVTILSPETDCKFIYKQGVIEALLILNSKGIPVPPHTVIIFPVSYSNNEIPVSYIEQNLIFLFPLENISYSIREYVIYQYLHELGHLLTGSFPQSYKWVGELLACSCNFFFFPKDNQVGSFYDVCITKETLDFEQIKSNFRLISTCLADNQRMVYKDNYQIKSALYSYSLEHSDFDFVSLLKQFSATKHLPQEQENLITQIINLFT